METTTYTNNDIVFLNIQSKDFFFTVQESGKHTVLSKIPRVLIDQPIDFDYRYQMKIEMNNITITKFDLSRKAKLRNLNKLLNDKTLDKRDKEVIKKTNFENVDKNYDFLMAGIYDLEDWKTALELKGGKE